MRRKTWNGINPVTRKPDNPKAYKREKAQKWSDDTTTDVPFIFISDSFKPRKSPLKMKR